ncbi:MAG: MFS transporter [Sphingomonadales bacterium]|nr:MFS transporter [Sphingomonadales bacterium]
MIGPLRLPVTRGGANPPARARLAFEVSGLYLALYLHFGFFAFLPLWLKASGAPPGEIGLLAAIPLVLRLLTVAPFSAWAGRRARVRDAIAATALGSAAVILLLLGGPGHVARAAIFLLFSVIWDQIPVLTDAYAVIATRSHALDFGRLRVWGSIGVVVSNVAAGSAIGLAGIGWLPAMVAALLLLPVAVVPLLPDDRGLAPVEEARPGRWRDVLGDRALLLAMAAASLVMGSHGVLNSFAAIQWAAQGLATGVIGLLQALAVSAEILAFWFGARLLGGRDPCLLIALGALAAMARWLIMATRPGIAVLVGAQLLNGVSATGTILGIMLVIAARVTSNLSAAAQGLNAVLFGAVLAVSTAGSGLLWSQGPAISYLAMAGLAALGALFAWTAWRAAGRDEKILPDGAQAQ